VDVGAQGRTLRSSLAILPSQCERITSLPDMGLQKHFGSESEKSAQAALSPKAAE
jgi:hypothetical protein